MHINSTYLYITTTTKTTTTNTMSTVEETYYCGCRVGDLAEGSDGWVCNACVENLSSDTEILALVKGFDACESIQEAYNYIKKIKDAECISKSQQEALKEVLLRPVFTEYGVNKE